MSDPSFLKFKATVENALPGAQARQAAAMAAMASAHEDQFHLLGLNRALAYAWRSLTCECPDATDEHRDSLLNSEVEFDDDELAIGQLWLPIIRARLENGAEPGQWTGTIAPNDEDFVEAWLRHHAAKGKGDHDADGWAGFLLNNYATRNLPVAWQMVQRLLRQRTTDWQLVMLGCGPLEDLIWAHDEDAVNLIAPFVTGNPDLSCALASVWISEREPRGVHIREYWAKRLAELGVETKDAPPPFLRINVKRAVS